MARFAADSAVCGGVGLEVLADDQVFGFDEVEEPFAVLCGQQNIVEVVGRTFRSWSIYDETKLVWSRRRET